MTIVKLDVGGKEFKCSKDLLTSKSKYFEDLFEDYQNWQIGDIIYMKEPQYIDGPEGNLIFMPNDYRFQIVDIILSEQSKVKVGNFGNPFVSSPARNRFRKIGEVIDVWLQISYFMSEEEWQMEKDAEKYNL